MRVTLAVHARAEPDLAQQRDRAGFQHAGADPVEHILAGLALEHDAVDAVAMQDMRQQQAGRAAADDRHLSSSRCGHCCKGNG